VKCHNEKFKTQVMNLNDIHVLYHVPIGLDVKLGPFVNGTDYDQTLLTTECSRHKKEL